MARELILIPKLKYERLMNDVKQARKDDEEKEHSMTDTIQSATDKKQSPPKGKSVDKQSFVRMKPEQFLQPKKRVETVKQKWVTFRI